MPSFGDLNFKLPGFRQNGKGKRYVVSQDPTQGYYPTISLALADAKIAITRGAPFIDIMILPGTYTENFTAVPKVNMFAFTADATSTSVIINGTITITSTGNYSFSGITFQTNSANGITISGSSSLTVYFTYCCFYATNSTCFSCTNSSATLYFYQMIGNAVGSNNPMSITSGNKVTITGGLFIAPSGVTNKYTIEATTVNIYNVISSIVINLGTTTANVFNCVFYATTGQTFESFGSNVNVYNSFIGNISSTVPLSIINPGTNLNFYNSVVKWTSTTICNSAGKTLTYVNSTSIGTNASLSRNITSNFVGGACQGLANQTPSPGYLGEQIRSAISSGSAVTLTTTVAANVTSISLTAGIWDVTGLVMFSGAVTGTLSGCSVGTTSATTGTKGDNYVTTPTVSTTGSDLGVIVPAYRISLTATTTVYLVGTATFSAGTQTAYGRISAIRVG